MRKALKFVKGSISTSNVVPKLKNVCSYNGRLQAFNGVTYAEHPLSENTGDFIVDGKKLWNAGNMCNWEHVLKLTKSNLIVRKANFSVKLPLTDEFNKLKRSQGDRTALPSNFKEVLKQLQPFMSRDASRPWSTSIMIRDGVACTTNNIILVFKDCEAPNMIIPADMVDLLLSIGGTPKSVCLKEGMSFVYENGAWVFCTGLEVEYPDMSQLSGEHEIEAVPLDYLVAIEKLISFDKEGFVTMKDGVLSNGEAMYEGFNLPDFCHHATPLAEVFHVMQTIDFSKQPSPFLGKGIRGVICGVQT